jgi:hypothetical protein
VQLRFPEAVKIRGRQPQRLVKHVQTVGDLTLPQGGCGQEGQKEGQQDRRASGPILCQPGGEQRPPVLQLATLNEYMPLVDAPYHLVQPKAMLAAQGAQALG